MSETAQELWGEVSGSGVCKTNDAHRSSTVATAELPLCVLAAALSLGSS